ncbi:probable ubiquitin-conjugating enzyme E2 18 [Asparagus officinalis]|uniref:probable ubiquitin-conjugating enzyme E2 18 n=1 Tax=Asparagus officinalis TaxID=4686 RepID=UPI00098E74C8|nr:probable ubiquitin-conjugating enzyme E2 18 [Asparagus officinalis]
MADIIGENTPLSDEIMNAPHPKFKMPHIEKYKGGCDPVDNVQNFFDLMSLPATTSSSRKALSKIACNRLQKELVEWQVNPPAGFKHKVSDNLQRWVIEVNGAQRTLYANETYQLQVDFHEHYPMEAPQVIFLNPAPLHPHIYSNEHICLEDGYLPIIFPCLQLKANAIMISAYYISLFAT